MSGEATGASAARGGLAPARHMLPRLGAEDLFAPLVAALLFAALSLASDQFLTEGNLVNVLTQMAVLAIVAFGVTIVMVGGGFDLSVGSQVALHGSVGALVMADTGSMAVGVAAALASGAVFGAANGLLIVGLRINPFIVTLGTLVVGRGIALTVTDSRPVTGLPEGLRAFGVEKFLGLPGIVWVMLACFVAAAYVLHATPFGLRVFATGGNREAARLAGIPVGRVTVGAFMLSGIFAAIAGMAVTARLRSGQPTTGEFLELFAVAAVVLGGSSLYGGRGAMWRTLVGVGLIAMIQNGLNLLNVSSSWQQIVIGIVFIAATSSVVLQAGLARVGQRRTGGRGRRADPGAGR